MSGFERRHNEITSKLNTIIYDKGLIDDETRSYGLLRF